MNGVLYSSTLETFSHSPFNVSFHSVTLLSPPLAANTFPLKLQETFHMTVSMCSTFFDQGPSGDSALQMMTLLSWLAVAM